MKTLIKIFCYFQFFLIFCNCSFESENNTNVNNDVLVEKNTLNKGINIPLTADLYSISTVSNILGNDTIASKEIIEHNIYNSSNQQCFKLILNSDSTLIAFDRFFYNQKTLVYKYMYDVKNCSDSIVLLNSYFNQDFVVDSIYHYLSPISHKIEKINYENGMIKSAKFTVNFDNNIQSSYSILENYNYLNDTTIVIKYNEQSKDSSIRKIVNNQIINERNYNQNKLITSTIYEYEPIQLLDTSLLKRRTIFYHETNDSIIINYKNIVTKISKDNLLSFINSFCQTP